LHYICGDMSMLKFLLVLLFPIIGFSQSISETDKQIILNEHNKYRTKVNVDNLEWSSNLATEAQSWANKLATAKCNIRHSNKKGLGENIFWSSEPVENVKEIVTDWASERKYYKYGVCCQGYKTLHYTQIIWQKTTKVGCGVAICKDGSQIWVCNYSPQGNFEGEKPYK